MNAVPLSPRHGDWARCLDQVAAGVGAFRRPSEDIFLSIGRGLHDAQNTARDLTILSSALNRRLSEPEFRATMDGLDAAVGAVKRLGGRKDERTGLLTAMRDTTASMKDALAGLARRLSHIRALGINARVEAAKMTGRGQDFTVFTHQIMRLASDGQAQVERATGALATLNRAIDGAWQRHVVFTETHMRRLTEVGDHLTNSVRLLKDRERQAAAVLSALPERLEHVRSHIANIVGNLQIGDITRQRLEHVETALDEVGRVLRPVPGPEGAGPLPAGLSDGHLAVLVSAVSELQGHQLEQICGDFTARLTSILADIDALISTLRAVTDDTQAVYADGAGGGSTFLMQVDRDLAQVLEIVALFGSAQQEAQAVMGEVGSAAQAMGGAMAAVAEIDAEINVIGLNASIKCGNMGDHGRALNVIAQELRGFAGHTRTHAVGVAAAIARLIELSEQAMTAQEGAGHADVAALQHTLGGSIEQLHQAGGETAWVLARIRDKGRDVAGTLESAAATLKEQLAAAAAVVQAAGVLTGLHQRIVPVLPVEGADEVRREVLAFLEDHYTMASERDLHGVLLGRAAQVAAPAAAAAAADDDLTDILF